jgi:hypothetical protein
MKLMRPALRLAIAATTSYSLEETSTCFFCFCNFPGVNCRIIVNLFNSLAPNLLSFKYLLSLISDSADSN